jgi:molybdopterin-guanine dinucleotide biosynthesis protein A
MGLAKTNPIPLFLSMNKKDTAIVIQAGGNSSRMKQNKALLDLFGKTIIERALERISSLGADHFIITDDINLYSFIKNVKIITDLVPGMGPLGGFVTALSRIDSPVLVMCACDMPFANLELFKFELDLLISQKYDVVIPQYQGRLEPLHAVYRKKTCLKPAEVYFQRGGRKIVEWFSQVNVKVICETEYPFSEPVEHAFFNVNTPEDYAAAQTFFLLNKAK